MKKFLEEQKQKLEKRKQELENELKTFAQKDPKIKGNWKTKFPDFGEKTPDFSEAEDQVEEYEETLPVEYALETDLRQINNALETLQEAQGQKYGICEKCHKKISKNRLKAYPEADICTSCSK